jgi:CRP-like cAMP-binding protein
MATPPPERLREIPLFAELTDESLKALAQIATEVEVPAGQVMIRPYDPGLGMFVVEEGRVVVERSS